MVGGGGWGWLPRADDSPGGVWGERGGRRKKRECRSGRLVDGSRTGEEIGGEIRAHLENCKEDGPWWVTVDGGVCGAGWEELILGGG